MTTILAFAGSNSSTSINRQLVEHAANLAAEAIDGSTITYLDLNDFEMPIFSQDRHDADGVPAPAQRFFDAIGEADAVIISLAEHNGGYSVAFKNVYDWASRIDMAVYQDKPLLLLATSPGGRGASGVLATAETSAPFFGAKLQGAISIPSFYDNFDSEKGELTDPELEAKLVEGVTALAEAVR